MLILVMAREDAKLMDLVNAIQDSLVLTVGHSNALVMRRDVTIREPAKKMFVSAMPFSRTWIAAYIHALMTIQALK